jgi:hypothetical protein
MATSSRSRAALIRRIGESREVLLVELTIGEAMELLLKELKRVLHVAHDAANNRVKLFSLRQEPEQVEGTVDLGLTRPQNPSPC